MNGFRRPHGIRGVVLAGSVVGLVVGVLLSFDCGGIRTVSRDGYRATLVFTPGDRYRIAVRGEWRRVDGEIDGAPLVKIMRPELKKTWQFRPETKRILEEAWSPTDEIVPGYPLDPHFDPQAYAGRFQAHIEKIADGAFGGHPCDRYQMELPSGDRVVIWAARDFERLPVRVEHAKKIGDEEYRPFLEVQLTDIRVDAEPKLFEKPKGYEPVGSYEQLRRAR